MTEHTPDHDNILPFRRHRSWTLALLWAASILFVLFFAQVALAKFDTWQPSAIQEALALIIAAATFITGCMTLEALALQGDHESTVLKSGGQE